MKQKFVKKGLRIRKISIVLAGLIIMISCTVFIVTQTDLIHAQPEEVINQDPVTAQEEPKQEEMISKADSADSIMQTEIGSEVDHERVPLDKEFEREELNQPEPSEVKAIEDQPVPVNEVEDYNLNEPEKVQEEVQKEPEQVTQPEMNPEVSSNRYAVDLLGLQMSQHQLVALIHQPNSNQLQALNSLSVVQHREELWEETMLIVPQHIGSTVTIYQLKFEDNELKEDYPVLTTQIVDENQIVALTCYLPEGIPNLKVVVEFQGRRVEYIVTADGVGNRPQIEYL